MTTENICAIGNFLNFYQTDLNYIKQFQEYKSGNIPPQKYIEKVRGSFYSFLIEFRVARNFYKGTVNKLLNETHLWIDGNDADNVDAFAEKLKISGLTKGVASSMASKILFLNNPYKILPMDALARNALSQKDNIYSTYRERLKVFKEANFLNIDECINSTTSFTSIIDNEFANIFSDIELVKRNRMIDKLLWTMGKSSFIIERGNH